MPPIKTPNPLNALFDPIKKVCYPRLEAHWDVKYKRRFPRHALKLLIFDFVLLVLASTLAVALVLVHTALPEIIFPRAVSVLIREPIALTSGAATELVIEYTNGADHMVRNAELSFETQGHFVLTNDNSAEPTDTERRPTDKRIYQLGDLPSQASGSLSIPGRAFIPPNQDLPIFIKLSYWEPGRANKTVSSIYYELPVESSPFDVQLNLPNPLLADTVNAITIDYTNNGAEDLPNAAVRFTPPPGFRITGARPVINRNNEWHLGSLPPQATGRLTVYGVLRSSATPSFSVTALAEAPDQQMRPLNEQRLNADSVSTGFVLTHDLGGLSTLVPGQSVPIRIKYANTGEQAISDVTISLQIDSPYYKANIEPLVWRPTDEPQLSKLPAGATGELTVDLQLTEYLSQEELLGETNPSLTVSASGEYYLSDLSQKTFRTDSQVTTLPISTKLLVNGTALYFTQANDQLGLGPWPLRVGEKTRLWLVLTVENGPNAVRNAKLTANLLPSAAWTNKTSVGTGRPLAYVASDRKLIWEIGDLPAFAGGHLPRATANFEIELTPTEDDLGQVLNLLDHIIIEGQDSFTGATVRATGPRVTSELRFGPEGVLSGVVE